MLKIQKVLLPTDFSLLAEKALAHAMHLARVFAAELHIVHVAERHEFDADGYAVFFPEQGAYASMLDRLTEKWEALARTAQEQGVSVVRAELMPGDPATQLRAYAEAYGMDVIVMATHGRNGVERLLLGSIAEEEIRRAPCPVLTIRSDADPVLAPVIRRILVPVDFSDFARLSLRYGAALAEAFGARLDLLHVLERPHQRDQGNAWLTLEQLAQEEDATADLHVASGRAARTIRDFAIAHQTDLIVIGTHGRTGLRRLLMGSVTEQVVRRAQCPVFTVKSFGGPLIVPPEDGVRSATS